MEGIDIAAKTDLYEFGQSMIGARMDADLEDVRRTSEMKKSQTVLMKAIIGYAIYIVLIIIENMVLKTSFMSIIILSADIGARVVYETIGSFFDDQTSLGPKENIVIKFLQSIKNKSISSRVMRLHNRPVSGLLS